ncbi:MAG TPA: hypothetical protein VGE21_12515 [Flavobacteriales bacterium]
MKRIITYPGTPRTPDPRPDQQPVPAQAEPKRKPLQQPTFLKSGLFVLALTASALVSAQTTPQQNPTGQQPNTNSLPNQGWTMFNDDVGTRLRLQGDQMQRLQNVDAQYADRYRALGNDPWLNDRYPTLTTSRNKEIQQILTPEQYKSWSSTYGGTTTGTRTENGTTSPEQSTDPDRSTTPKPVQP